ncbi:MAG TPA: hypothetical protein VLF91_05635 [Candidatus Saccharimonadales bacterium]|nr:hypothetical protein [Candidatus Saccharimonadales bacterium]
MVILVVLLLCLAVLLFILGKLIYQEVSGWLKHRRTTKLDQLRHDMRNLNRSASRALSSVDPDDATAAQAAEELQAALAETTQAITSGKVWRARQQLRVTESRLDVLHHLVQVTNSARAQHRPNAATE